MGIMKIEEYLKAHTILKIGITLPGYVCCETIVDDPEELVSVVREGGCYIKHILWWHRTEIATVSEIGYGGPRDPKCPDTYFYAETYIEREFDTPLQDEEYHKYFEEIKQTYSAYEIYPAFDIAYL